MAAQAAPVGGIYIAGVAVIAGIAYLRTPHWERTATSLGDAMYQGGAAAVDDIKSLFEPKKKSKAHANERTATVSNERQRKCDGPHRGRLQVQGYAKNIDPHPIELSYPWSYDCSPPLKPEGLAAISLLLLQTQAISYKSAGYRGAAFSKMSKYIKKAPPIGFLADHRIGFGIAEDGSVKINQKAGRNPARVDLEVRKGRAFGLK